jgi:hypothetical protein
MGSDRSWFLAAADSSLIGVWWQNLTLVMFFAESGAKQRKNRSNCFCTLQYSVLDLILVAGRRRHGVHLVFFDVHFALLRLLELVSGALSQ